MLERRNTLKAALATGRDHIGIWRSLAPALTTKIDPDRYLAEGLKMIAVGSNPGLLARGSDALMASFDW